MLRLTEDHNLNNPEGFESRQPLANAVALANGWRAGPEELEFEKLRDSILGLLETR